MTPDEILSYGNLVIPLAFGNGNTSIGNTLMTIVERDKKKELCIYVMSDNNDDEVEQIIFVSQPEWTIMTSELLNSCIKLAVDIVVTDHQNKDALLSIISKLDPTYGVKHYFDKNCVGIWNFRIGPNLCISISKHLDSVAINISDYKHDPAENCISLNSFTLDYMREHYTNFSSLIRD